MILPLSGATEYSTYAKMGHDALIPQTESGENSDIDREGISGDQLCAY